MYGVVLASVHQRIPLDIIILKKLLLNYLINHYILSPGSIDYLLFITSKCETPPIMHFITVLFVGFLFVVAIAGGGFFLLEGWIRWVYAIKFSRYFTIKTSSRSD